VSKTRAGRGYSARASCSHVLYPLPPLRSKGEVRCSPRLRRCSSVVRNGFAVSSSRKTSVFRTTTRSAHRRVWPSVQSVGVGHSEPPVNGSRLRSPELSPEPRSGGLTRRLRLVNAVSTPDANSDAETGTPDRNKREPGRPERGRSGEFTPCPLYEERLFCMVVYQSPLVHSTRPPEWDFDHATHDSSPSVGLLPTTPAHHSVGRPRSILSRER